MLFGLKTRKKEAGVISTPASFQHLPEGGAGNSAPPPDQKFLPPDGR